MIDKYFTLYPCCKLVKGYNKNVICDIQRNAIYPIPLSFYELFNLKYGSINFHELIKEYKNNGEVINILNEYICFLKEKELGVFGDSIEKFQHIDMQFVYEPRIITNCIIDIDVDSHYCLSYIANQLNSLYCEALEIRYYCDVALDKVCADISNFKNSKLRSIEIVKKISEEQPGENEFFILKNINFRVTKLSLHSAEHNMIKSTPDYSIVYTKSCINDETCCGNISEYYLNAQTQSFIEAMHYNTCLNRKISIDKNGNIKNCPSMHKIFGNIYSKDSLVKIANTPEFQKIWSIKKDNIKVCKDCELRYVCQDCRAYLSDPDDIYSKPAKCNYNPYAE